MKALKVSMVAALAVALFAATSWAQEPEGKKPAPEGKKKARDGERPKGKERPGGGPGFFRFPPNPLADALDTNKDGEISAEEISAAVTSLKKLDKNSDGKLTRDELRPQFSGRPGGSGGPGGPGGGRGLAGFLERFDENKDGKITKDELPERAQALLDRADTNKDGAIDKAELEKLSEGFRGGRPGGEGAGPPRKGRPKRPDGDGARPKPKRPDTE